MIKKLYPEDFMLKCDALATTPSCFKVIVYFHRMDYNCHGNLNATCNSGHRKNPHWRIRFYCTALDISTAPLTYLPDAKPVGSDDKP